MNDPLAHYYNLHGVDTTLIRETVPGNKYLAVHLNNGNLGVCSTLNQQVTVTTETLESPDLENVQHRILLNAYYNALLNYNNSYDKNIDIFDQVDFKKYRKVVMVGFFRSLVKKFEKDGIPLTIFDKMETSEKLTPMEEQMRTISQADAVILSGTTVFNMTYGDIMEATSPESHVFLLGPSNILDQDMFAWPSLKVVFGSVFEPHDQRVIDVIRSGGGTPSFLQWMKKVYIEKQL